MVLSLMAVTLGAGLSLGFVYEVTKAPIAEAQRMRQLQAIQEVVPPFSNEPLAEAFKVGADSLLCYPATSEGKAVGMAVKAFSSEGYSGEVWLMVGFDAEGRIHDIQVLEHRETPGLGTKMADEKFRAQFRGHNPETLKMQVKKDGGEIDGISGATISSRAFAQAVEQAWKAYQESN